MTFFTIEEFSEKYNQSVEEYQIEMASEMIYSQIGLTRRGQWNNTNVPDPVKRASMEQLRFMLEYEIPLIDYKNKVKAGDMESELSSDYSTLALRILSNNGYLYRGIPINYNMKMEIPF